METEVGGFRGVFENGYSWDKTTALNLFYNFLMPNILTGGGYTKQKIAKKGIISWATSKDDWKRRVPEFDVNTFDAINEEALNILLNTSLGDLNNNRYYEDEDEEQVEQSFDKPEVSRVNRDTGEVETIKLQYGKNLTNKPSLQIETDKQNAYWQIREELKLARMNAERRKEELKDASGELKEKAEKDLANAITVVEGLVKQLEDTRKRAYNDDITLRQVMENDPKIEQFYSVIELSGEGLTDKQKVALGLVREVTITNEARSKAEYEEIYGSDMLSYEEFKEMVEKKEREYIKMLGLPIIIDNRFAELSDKSIDVEIRLIDLLSDNNLPSKRFLDILRELEYPLTIGENTYDSVSAITDSIKNKMTNKDELIKLFQFIVKRWYSNNVEPFLNQQAEFTITETTLEKPDLKDTPIRISKENLLNYVTDWEEQRLISDDVFKIASGSDSTQSKLKINLDFKNKAVSMESALAAEVGATSTDVISQVKESTAKKGTIDIDYVINIKGNEDFKNELPLLEAQDIFKSVGPILTRYGMRTKTSPDEAAKNTARKSLTRGKFNILVEFMTMMKELKEAEEQDLGKSLFDEKTKKRLNNFNAKIFFDGDDFKYEYLEFIDKLTNRRTQLAKNIQDEMENLSLLAGFLTNFIEENMELLQTFEEEDFEDLSNLSEEDREKRFQELERETQRSIASEQERQEAIEERELETEQEEAGQTDEGDVRLIGSMVEGAGEEMEFQEQIENNKNVLEALIGILEDKDDFDKGALNIPMLKTDIDNARKAAEEQINTPSFRKSVKRFVQLLKQLLGRDAKLSESKELEKPKEINMEIEIPEEELDESSTLDDLERDTDELIEMIKNIEGDSVDEETRISIKRYKETITNYWNVILKSKSNKLFDEKKLLSLIPELKLEEGIAEDMQRDKAFNDGRLGKITLSAKKLVLSLDYMNKQAQLKGKIAWQSKGTSSISYKIKGGKAPKYTGALGETQSQRKLRGKYATYQGKEQDISYRANPVDELRYEFLQEVKRNMQVLMGVIK
jgi:hypothetical protein